MRIFVDMDNVMVDYYSGLAATRADLSWIERETDPLEYGDECRRTFGGREHDLLEHLYKLPHQFWAYLQVMPGLAKLLDAVVKFDPDWRVLTRGVESEAAWSGKYAWMKRYFPKEQGRLIIMGYVQSHTAWSGKELIAGPGAILIDDSPNNCLKWDAAGGNAFHWKGFRAIDPDLETNLNEQTDRLRRWLRRIDVENKEAAAGR